MEERRQKEGAWREGQSKERKGRAGQGEGRKGKREGQSTHKVSVSPSGSVRHDLHQYPRLSSIMFMIITIINDSEFDHYFTLLFELVIITEYLFSNIESVLGTRSRHF